MAKLNIMTMSPAERDAHNAAQLAKLTTLSIPAVDYHRDVLKNWQVKLSGPKPTLDMLKLGYVLAPDRRAGIENTWLGMTFRANGATVGEYMRATSAGGAAHNNAKKYCEAGWLIRVPLPNTDRQGRWQHVITEKGIIQLDKRIAQLTAAGTVTQAPVKAKAAAPKKAKAKKQTKASNGVSVAPVTVTPSDNATTEPVAAEPVTAQALTDLAQHFNS